MVCLKLSSKVILVIGNTKLINEVNNFIDRILDMNRPTDNSLVFPEIL